MEFEKECVCKCTQTRGRLEIPEGLQRQKFKESAFTCILANAFEVNPLIVTLDS